MKVELLPSRLDSRSYLERALGLQLAPGADWTTTYAAFTLRRLVGVLAPCSRRELLAQARRALAGVIQDDLDDLITGALEDLLVGGDVLELPALIANHAKRAPVLLFGATPSFIVQEGSIRIIGIAIDDARFLPEGIHARVLARGGDRFIQEADVAPLASLLTDLGLRQIDAARWLGIGTDEPATAFLRRVRELVAARGRDEQLADVSWLWPSDGRYQGYRARWQSTPPEGVDLAVARAPQVYGNPRWYVIDPTRPTRYRLLDLPIEDEVTTRGCDTAWSVQLALDAERGSPMRYHVMDAQDGWIQLRLEFPLPLHHRRRLLRLGGRRTTEDHGFRFHVPAVDLPSAEAILNAAWMSRAS